MTQKHETKPRSEPTPTAGPSPEELQAAYQVHTLAQMLYGQMAMTQPWIAQAPPMACHQPMAGPQMPYPQYPQMNYPQQGWQTMAYGYPTQPYAAPSFPFGFYNFPR